MKYKQIKVPEDLHREFKIFAAKRRTTMIKLIKGFLNAKDKNTKTV